MRVERWASAAALAVALAAAPGMLRLVAADGPAPERAPLWSDPAAPGLRAPGEVPITPPDVLTGEVAVATAPAPTFAATAAPAEGEVFALLIGIDDYPGRRHDLSSAVADVDTIDASLAGFGVPPGNRVVLRDGQATRATVVAAVASLVAQGGPDATYVLGYAGHARRLDRDTQALVLADGELLLDRDLAALLAPATTQRMWILLASCFAGGFTEVVAPGRVLTAAAPANRLAWEDPALNGSYLVHYLVRQGWLEGRAAGPSVQDAYAYADAALARDHPNRRPVQVDGIGSDLVLGLGDPTGGLAAAPPVPEPPPPPPPNQPAPPPSSPSTTAPPRDDEDDGQPCVLGVVYC